MREIKFRAWDKENKFFWDDEAIAQEFENFRTDNDYALIQFTGLFDKNGKEIYEGDMVRMSNDVIALVKDIRTFWVAYFGKPEGETPSEIIGNLYENPELLT